MKTKDFWDVAQARSYMLRCVVMCRGEPVYIHNIDVADLDRTFRITYQRLDGYDLMTGWFPGPEWDLTIPPLGMVNLPRGIGYVARYPLRQWKIGVCRENTKSYPVAGRDYFRASLVPTSQEERDMMVNNYPTFPEVIGKGFGAFSRRFAVHQGKLIYKTRGTVGRVIDDQPVLNEQFFYLREALTEDYNAAGAEDIPAVRVA